MRILSRGRTLTLSGCRLLASSLASCFLNFTTFASVAMDCVALVFQSRDREGAVAPPLPHGRGSDMCSCFAERHAEGPQQFAGLVVAIGAGHERHVHALGERHLVRVDLGENGLL